MLPNFSTLRGITAAMEQNGSDRSKYQFMIQPLFQACNLAQRQFSEQFLCKFLCRCLILCRCLLSPSSFPLLLFAADSSSTLLIILLLIILTLFSLYQGKGAFLWGSR